MEYLYTNLPRYITVTPRSAFADSVVQSGSVLLFSEDGTTLTAKLPDGSFVSVGGSGGTDVSDTTATAEDVLSGKDFHLASGVKATGSIQTVTASLSGNVVTVPAGYIASAQTITVGTAKTAQTYTPGTTDQTIASGQYLTGDQTIKGDANLLAANIVSGVTIFGVTGTASCGATDFYKCASVDTVNHTWTGYKAVFNSTQGYYEFEQTATSGLTYSVVTPVVGNVYADGALIEAKLYEGIPTDYVFYAPLDVSAAAAETGQSWTQTNMTYSTVSGRACAVFSGSSFINPAMTGFPTGNTDHTISMNLYITSAMDGRSVYLLAFGSDGSNTTSTIAANNGHWAWCFGGSWDYTNVAYPQDQWFNVVRKYTAATGLNELYVNGVKVAEISRPCSIDGSSCTIGSYLNNNTDESFIGNMCGLRVYDRALSAAEIAALAAEFTPSAGA